ncbi:MAG: methyltransferase domain-containing protein [Bacteroidota bacterium]
MDHYQQVKSFFNRTAARYREKPRPFRAYYFGERMKIALSAIRPGKRVLDAGCGRGELYDKLAVHHSAGNYLGLDTSEQMLAFSHIPAKQQYLGSLENYAAEEGATNTVDCLVALGLTTYYRADDLPNFYRAVSTCLAPTQSVAVISYTHRRSWDYRLRHALQRNFASLFPRNRSLGRSFEIYATTPEQVSSDLPADLDLIAVHWLPPAVPLLTHWFPRWSVRLSKGMLRNWGPNWCGDFVVELKKAADKISDLS